MFIGCSLLRGLNVVLRPNIICSTTLSIGGFLYLSLRNEFFEGRNGVRFFGFASGNMKYDCLSIASFGSIAGINHYCLDVALYFEAHLPRSLTNTSPHRNRGTAIVLTLYEPNGITWDKPRFPVVLPILVGGWVKCIQYFHLKSFLGMTIHSFYYTG